MFNYSRKHQWVLDSVQFDYLGGTYTGRGLLNWNPRRGFNLNAFLDRSGAPLPQSIDFGKIRVVRTSELRRVRMILEGGARAITAGIPIGDHVELIHSNHLSVDIASVLFIRHRPPDPTGSGTSGSALFDLGTGLVLPDRLEDETRLLGQFIKKGTKLGGLVFESDDLIVRACLESDTYLRMQWQLMGKEWTRKHAWAWSEAAGWTLSFLGGRTVRLLERSTVRGRREFVERRAPGKVDYLRLLSLPPRTSLIPDCINKEEFVKLVGFFARKGKEVDVALRMCEQMTEASRQNTRVGSELLCSTILEAALRTLTNHPFEEGDKSFNLAASLKWFREHYFPSEWEDACDEAKRCHIRMRNRNAHPDWLTGNGGGLSEVALDRSLDDRIRLAWFYGYMILAMAGFDDLEPKFPGSHKTWKPLMTVTLKDQPK